MKISSLTNLSGVQILSRDAQSQILGGLVPPAHCTAKCWNGSTVSCSTKAGQCSATDKINGALSGRGKCSVAIFFGLYCSLDFA